MNPTQSGSQAENDRLRDLLVKVERRQADVRREVKALNAENRRLREEQPDRVAMEKKIAKLESSLAQCTHKMLRYKAALESEAERQGFTDLGDQRLRGRRVERTLSGPKFCAAQDEAVVPHKEEPMKKPPTASGFDARHDPDRSTWPAQQGDAADRRKPFPGGFWWEPWCEEHAEGAESATCVSCVGASHDAWMHRAKAAEAALREILNHSAGSPREGLEAFINVYEIAERAIEGGDDA